MCKTINNTTFSLYMKKLILILFILCSCSNRNTINQNLIVKNFDLNKYLGTWYEIAKSDN